MSEDLTNDIRAAWVRHVIDSLVSPEARVYGLPLAVEQFDNWIREVRAHAWDEAIDAAAQQGTIQVPDNPYREEEIPWERA